jgi:hypothetical protein
MDKVFSKLTVLFEEPFWILLYEYKFGRKYEVCKVTFPKEPKDFEIYSFLLKNRNKLKFSPSVFLKKKTEVHKSPKRIQKEIRNQLKATTIGTKAQNALKLLQEQNKTERKLKTREEREQEKERQFQISKAKRKEKHKGH